MLPVFTSKFRSHPKQMHLGKPLLENFNFGKPLIGEQPLGNSPWESSLGKFVPWEYDVLGNPFLGNRRLGKHPLGKPPLRNIPWEKSGNLKISVSDPDPDPHGSAYF